MSLAFNWPIGQAQVSVVNVSDLPASGAGGTIAYVATTQCLYMLASDGVTWNFFLPSPALAAQATWYVDATNGSDSNSGLVGFPIKTSTELCRRLSPNFQVYTPRSATTTINFAAGSYGELALNVDWPAGTTDYGAVLFIECAYTSTANMTLTAVTNTASGTSTRGQITVGSGSLTAKKRIRSTSGAHIGAVAYSTGQNANAQNHFVSTWYDYNASATVTIANGTTVAVDTLAVSFTGVNIYVRDPGYIQIDSAILNNGANIQDLTKTFRSFLVGCEMSGSFWGDYVAAQCRITATAGHGLGYGYFEGCTTQAAFTASVGSYMIWGSSAPCTVDGGSVGVQFGGMLWLGDVPAGQTEYCNGTAGNAISNNNSNLTINALQWGGSTNYAVGLAVTSCSHTLVNNAAPTAFLAVPATQQVTMSGNNRTYAQLPCDYQRAACFIAIANDTTAAVNST